ARCRGRDLMISFSQPLWLLLLLPLIYGLWKIQQLSFEEASRARQYFWFAIRMVVLVLIIFALAGFQLKSEVRQKQVLFLLDVSDSISSDQRDQAIQLLNQSVSKIHSPDQVGIIVFAKDAAVERFPAAPRLLQNIESRVETGATNFENASSLAQALL